MKILTLTDNYEIVSNEHAGDKLQITFHREHIEKDDCLYLANYPHLQSSPYLVTHVSYMKGLYYADLLKVPDDKD